jgi:hypothetical protein
MATLDHKISLHESVSSSADNQKEMSQNVSEIAGEEKE